jgi:hypothetical protein
MSLTQYVNLALVAFLKKIGVNKKMTFPSGKREEPNRTQPKGIKPIIRERKLRKGVNWQGAVKQKRVKHTGVKQRLGCIWV